MSVSDRSDSINERTHTDQQQNKITYSMGVPEVPMNKLGNWLMLKIGCTGRIPNVEVQYYRKWMTHNYISQGYYETKNGIDCCDRRIKTADDTSKLSYCAYSRRDGQAEFIWKAGYILRWFSRPQKVAHRSTNRAQRKLHWSRPTHCQLTTWYTHWCGKSAFKLAMTLIFDRWPWKPFQQYPRDEYLCQVSLKSLR